MPVALAVQVVALACADRDTTDTGSENAETTASTSGVADGSTSAGPIDCAAMTVQAECEGHPSCAWYPEFGGCVIDCTPLDEETCNKVPHCEWFGTLCDLEPVA